MCLGCTVHAHREIPQKLAKEGSNQHYQWAIGTRTVNTHQDEEPVLQEVKSLGSTRMVSAKGCKLIYAPLFCGLVINTKDCIDIPT